MGMAPAELDFERANVLSYTRALQTRWITDIEKFKEVVYVLQNLKNEIKFRIVKASDIPKASNP
jgi:hypothetical protein